MATYLYDSRAGIPLKYYMRFEGGRETRKKKVPSVSNKKKKRISLGWASGSNNNSTEGCVVSNANSSLASKALGR